MAIQQGFQMGLALKLLVILGVLVFLSWAIGALVAATRRFGMVVPVVASLLLAGLVAIATVGAIIGVRDGHRAALQETERVEAAQIEARARWMAAHESTGIQLPDTPEGEKPEAPQPTAKATEKPGGMQSEAKKSAAKGAPPVKVPAVSEVKGPAEKRPDWVESPPQLVDGVYCMSVTVGPYKTRRECDQKLPEELDRAVAEYVEEEIGPGAAALVHLPRSFIEEHLVKAEWEEKFRSATPEIGVMLRVHKQLKFDHQAAQRVKEVWDQVAVDRRVRHLATGLGMVLLLLAVSYSYLKLDLATGGNYRGRLRLAAGLMIVALLFAAVHITRLS